MPRSRKKKARKRRQHANPYEQREQNCRQLGFKNYRDYLRSDLWRTIKESVFAAKGRVCKICQKTAYTLHHMKYTQRALLGKDVGHLIPICRQCHQSIEVEGGRLVGLTAANRRYKAKQRQYRRDNQ